MAQQFSPNMLKTYDLCSRKFYYKYVKNISMPVNNEVFEFGKNIHALASYYLNNQNILDMELSLTDKELAVWNYLKSLKYLDYKLIATEYSLSFKINGIVFGGRIDALVKNGDQYFILDYKTGSVPKDVKYDYQTMIYTIAVSKFFKTFDVNFVYLDLKNKSEAMCKFSESLQTEYSKRLLTVVNNINSDSEYAKKDKCSCEYSSICY